MNRTSKGLVVTAAAVLTVLFMLVLSCSSGQSAADIATAMANKLTEEIGFTGGTIKSSSAPAEHVGDPTVYPQVTGVNGDSLLSSGKQFSFNIAYDYSGSSAVTGAVVKISKYYFVEGGGAEPEIREAYATEYIEIQTQRTEGGLVLQGTPSVFDSSLIGKPFQLWFAVLKSDGTVGNYQAKDVMVESGGGTDAGVTDTVIADGDTGRCKTPQDCPEGQVCGPEGICISG
ncbi:MAG: hypothetical protein WC889_19475 [Myxococcota bacterium]|jgi:hypothetical protein